MKPMLISTEVTKLIESGKVLFLAGSEEALKQLPKGQWIGGTIPYFMTQDGGIVTDTLIQVTELPEGVKNFAIKEYTAFDLPKIPQNYYQDGFSLIIIPAFSEAHQTFAKDCSTWSGIFDQPLIGWISGTDLDAVNAVPKVFNGLTGGSFNDRAVVIHAQIGSDQMAVANIVNIFQQGNGDTIAFSSSGFEADQALINGKKMGFADYLESNKIDFELPMVADYNGAMVNVSFRDIDPKTRKVRFFAPVFPDVKYKIAKNIGDYEKQFEEALKEHQVAKPLFACNCILNFVYAKLKGKKSGHHTSAMTFGEIAYMLLNQTFVYISLERRPPTGQTN